MLERCSFNVFPYAAEAIYFYTPPAPAGSQRLVQGCLQFADRKLTESSFDVLDETHRVVARIEQWRDRYFEMPVNYYECGVNPQAAYLSSPWLQAESGCWLRRIWPFPDNFFTSSYGIWARILAHLTLSRAERQIWHQFNANDPQRVTWLLGQIVAKDVVRQWAMQTLNIQVAPADIEIAVTTAGHCQAVCPELAAIAPIPPVTVAAYPGGAVAMLVPPEQRAGLHLQQSTHATDQMGNCLTAAEQEWLLASGYDPKSAEILAAFGSAKQAATRAVFGNGNLDQWQIHKYNNLEQQVLLICDQYSCQVKLWLNSDEVLAICLLPQQA